MLRKIPTSWIPSVTGKISKVHDYSSLEENAKTFGMAINGDKGMELIYF